MMIVKGNESMDRQGPPPRGLMVAMDEMIAAASESGRLVSMGGLQHTRTGARVRIDGGRITRMDGPFTESKEVIGGFMILELDSREQAIEEAVKFMELHRVHWPEWEGETEVRLMFGEGDGPS